jgi:hypothetical protein
LFIVRLGLWAANFITKAIKRFRFQTSVLFLGKHPSTANLLSIMSLCINNISCFLVSNLIIELNNTFNYPQFAKAVAKTVEHNSLPNSINNTFSEAISQISCLFDTHFESVLTALATLKVFTLVNPA